MMTGRKTKGDENINEEKVMENATTERRRKMEGSSKLIKVANKDADKYMK